MSKEPTKSVVYVPSGAKINLSAKSLKEPPVEYERRKASFGLEQTKKVVGGKYGRTARNKLS